MNSGFSLGDYTVAPAPTFGLPDDSERKNLRVGDYAKLVFEVPGDGMRGRMWVKVTDVIEPGVYRGHLDNRPLLPLEIGMAVEFEWKNVVSIYLTYEDRAARNA